jgi:selenide, water dikinase
VKSMTTLNKCAVEAITGHVGTSASAVQAERSSPGFRVNAMTDITGFGLIGHLREMVLASQVSASISAGSVPLLDGAIDCVRAGHIPGGLKNNRDFAECLVEYETGVSEDVKTLLFDPQTAGGLLISTPDGTPLLRALHDAGVPAVRIGEIVTSEKPKIRVTI